MWIILNKKTRVFYMHLFHNIYGYKLMYVIFANLVICLRGKIYGRFTSFAIE